ncbi:MAG TPA: phosphate ABC transporter permease PstA [Candidatus Dormibacteraeota bacterium]|nr:phosphate ABC transporter permease PstA [Candidatus Dormibacteraeota bacterium]
MNARLRRQDRIAVATVRLMVGLLLLLLGWLVVTLLIAGWAEMSRAGFWTRVPDIAGPGGGIAPQLFNTVYMLVLAMLITLPIGLAGGVFFAEYAGTGRIANLLRRASETLATLPSIVVGLFGYALFVQATGSHPSRLAGALSLTVINLPYVVRISEDALRALPPALREGSLALGATRWQTIWKVQLPAALPALITGAIIAAGRVFGEAAAILFTGSNFALTAHSNYSLNPLLPGDTLAVDLYVFRTQAEPNVVPDARQYADGVAAVLILAVLVFNVSARLLGRVVVRRLQKTG